VKKISKNIYRASMDCVKIGALKSHVLIGGVNEFIMALSIFIGRFTQ